jgi:DNA-binding transcriptional ArsR family regulator/DNA-binding PadR family transcriptional regulator
LKRRASLTLIMQMEVHDMKANIAVPAALIGDPVRAAMLSALCDGRAQPATALAYAARVTPQSASNHLTKLLEGGLLAVESEGRHRYYRLATPDVAAALEALACVAPAVRSLDAPLTREGRSLRFGRSCYDHLAGRLGVAITTQLEARRYLVPSDEQSKRYSVTTEGRQWFAGLGIDVDLIKPHAKGVARRCLDWTERRHHLAGPLGVALLSRLVELKWACRDGASRAVSVTPQGAAELQRRLEIDTIALQQAGTDISTRVEPRRAA